MDLTDEQAEYVAERLWHLFMPAARHPPIITWEMASKREKAVMRAKAKVLLQGMPG